MNIKVNTSAVLQLAVGTLSSGPEDRHLDQLVIYPDDNLIFIPNEWEMKLPGFLEEGDDKKVMWVQDEELMGFYIEEIISITEI